MHETLILILRYMVVHHPWTLFICLLLVAELARAYILLPLSAYLPARPTIIRLEFKAFKQMRGRKFLAVPPPPELPPFLQAATADVVSRLNKIFRSHSKLLWCSFHMFYWS